MSLITVPTAASVDSVHMIAQSSKRSQLPFLVSDRLRKAKKHRGKPVQVLKVGVDSEFVARVNTPNQYITLQVAFGPSSQETFVMEHPDLGDGILSTWSTRYALNQFLVDEGWCETHEPDEEVDGYLVYRQLMFYSPADVLGSQFRRDDFDISLGLQRLLNQQGRVKVAPTNNRYRDYGELPFVMTDPDGKRWRVCVEFNDLSMVVGKSSLERTAASLGVEMPDKGLMDKYKTDMLVPYRDPNQLQLFCDYAESDAYKLFEIEEATIARNEMLAQTVGCSIEKPIFTTGSLTSNIWLDLIRRIVGESSPWQRFQRRKGTKMVSYDLESYLELGSVGHFLKTHPHDGLRILGDVQGGRCKHEDANVFRAFTIADVDVKSCYASVMSQMYAYIGMPATYSNHISCPIEKMLTLKEFLKRYEDELQDDGYQIVVSGDLDFPQDLIPSKIGDVDQTGWLGTWDTDLGLDLRIYTHEIKHGIITSYVLDSIRKIATPRELRQFMRLRVVAASWYPKSLTTEDPEEFDRLLSQADNVVTTETDKFGHKVTSDKRSCASLRIPLSKLIKPYKDKRLALKDERKNHEKGSREYFRLDAEQNAMKLVANGGYGSFACEHFVTSNPVIANNITSAVRVALWLTRHALGLKQVITDGGPYELNGVPCWTRNKPGFESLFTGSQRISTCPLGANWETRNNPELQWVIEGVDKETNVVRLARKDGAYDWTATKEGWADLNELVLKHVFDFWADKDGNSLNLKSLSFLVFEHKHVYAAAAFNSQSNYLFRNYFSDPSYRTILVHGDESKARGYKKIVFNNEGVEEPSNAVSLLEQILENPSRIPAYPRQYQHQMLKIEEANKMATAIKPNEVKEKGLLAGDSIRKSKWARPISLSMFYWQDDEQYQSWSKGCDKLKNKTGWGVESFFVDADGFLDYEDAVKVIKKAIDKGWGWDEFSRTYRPSHTLNHPYLS